MKNSKKRFFTFVSIIAYLLVMFSGGVNSDVNATNQNNNKVFFIDPYTNNADCIGSGGSCLPVVVIAGDEC